MTALAVPPIEVQAEPATTGPEGRSIEAQAGRHIPGPAGHATTGQVARPTKDPADRRTTVQADLAMPVLVAPATPAPAVPERDVRRYAASTGEAYLAVFHRTRRGGPVTSTSGYTAT